MELDFVPEDFDLLAYVDENGKGLITSEAGSSLPEFDGDVILELLQEDNFEDLSTTDSSNSCNSPTESDLYHDPGIKKCPICGALAGKHCYYGANTCSGCRMFFQRAVKSKKFAQKQCTKGGTCSTIISSTSRRVCKVCRFKKCLEVGMKPSYVMTGQQNGVLSHHPEDTRTANAHQDPGKSFSIARKNFEVMSVFTLEEKNVFAAEFGKFATKSYDTVIDFYHQQPGMYQVLLTTVFQGRTSDLHCLKSMTKLDEDILMQYCMGNPEFEDLYFHDRMILINHNFPILFGFMWSVFCMPEFLMSYLGGLIKHVNQGSNQKGKELLHPLQTSQPTKLNQGVEKIGSHEDPFQLVKNMRQIQNWLKSSSDPFQDNVLIVLILKAFLFSTEFQDEGLRNGPKIKVLHQRSLFQLHRYLKLRFPDSANRKLHQLFLLSLGAKDVFNALQTMTIG